MTGNFPNPVKNMDIQTSGQDGGIGRHTVPPRTTKKRTTTILKIKNNQNWQKIKLYGSPTTKELKKKHSSRLAGGVEMGSQGGEDSWQGSGWRDWTVPHLRADKTGRTTRERDRPTAQGSSREIKPQTSDWQHLWGLRRQREELPASLESLLERPTGS